MLSAKAKYGLKAMLSLATEPGPRPVLGNELATREHIPKKFLEQILLELKHRGLLQSKRGPHGGYVLTRSPSAVSVGEIVRALDGPVAPIPCVSLTAYVKCDECQDEQTCGIRLVMKQVRDATARILDSTTLADTVRMVAAAARGIPDTTSAPKPAEANRPGAVGITVRFRDPGKKLKR